MKAYILDTHILLWALQSPTKITKPVWKILDNPRSDLYVSAASIWETAYLLDSRPDELRLDKPLAGFWNDALVELRLQVLNITPEHAQRFYEIQPLKGHTDPFDRMIIAQAASTGIPLISNDGKFPRYGMITVIEN